MNIPPDAEAPTHPLAVLGKVLGQYLPGEVLVVLLMAIPGPVFFGLSYALLRGLPRRWPRRLLLALSAGIGLAPTLLPVPDGIVPSPAWLPLYMAAFGVFSDRGFTAGAALLIGLPPIAITTAIAYSVIDAEAWRPLRNTVVVIILLVLTAYAGTRLFIYGRAYVTERRLEARNCVGNADATVAPRTMMVKHGSDRLPVYRGLSGREITGFLARDEQVVIEQVCRATQPHREIYKVKSTLSGTEGFHAKDDFRPGPGPTPRMDPEIVSITSPAPAAILTDLSVLVRGTIHLPSLTSGVAVNGQPGYVEGDQFVAHVRLQKDDDKLTASVRDFTRLVAVDSVPVTVDRPSYEDSITLRIQSPGGLAPLTTQFSLQLHPRLANKGIMDLALDADGDGVDDFHGTTVEGFTFTYTAPGIYTPRITLTTAAGKVYTDTGVVQVYDPAEVDARIQATWQAFTGALRTGGSAAAAPFVCLSIRDYFLRHAPVGPLADPNPEGIPIALVRMGPDLGIAQYQCSRTEDAQAFRLGITFRQDSDGDGMWHYCSPPLP
jgi:hypothetical protein